MTITRLSTAPVPAAVPGTDRTSRLGTTLRHTGHRYSSGLPGTEANQS